jgi:hypothetical protein
MTRPRSDPRSGASSRPEPDAAALRRELYRPGADHDAVLAYLAAAEAEHDRLVARDEEETARGTAARGRDAGGTATRGADADAPGGAPLPVHADGGVENRPPGRWRRVAAIAGIAVAVPVVGVALLPRSAPPPTPAPRPTAMSSTVAVAPARFDGLRGGSTLLVALPFRTFRVRVRLQCDRRAFYGWTALGEDAQTQQFLPVMSHSAGTCLPSDSYIGSLPGDVSNLRIRVVVEGGSYSLTVEPL